MYAAHDSLPPALRARAQGLMVKHDGTYNSGGFLRAGVTPTDDPRNAPGHLHPLVCRHPDTGRSMLYLGRRRMAYIDGLSLAESEALLDELWSYADASRRSAGRMPGASAIWCCGITAAPCIGATPSMPRRDG